MPDSNNKWTLLAHKLRWTLERIHPNAGCAEMRDRRGHSLLLTHEQRDDILEALDAVVPRPGARTATGR